MATATIIIIICFSFIASFIQRVTGFGFGIFIMTVLPYLMPSYGEATALSGILATVGIAVTCAVLWKYIEWKKLWPILLTFTVVSFFSVKLLTSVNDALLKKILGGILIAVSLYFFLAADKIKIRPTVPIQVGMGTLSGLMGGLFAMQGPPAVIYFLSCTGKKENYTALAAIYFVVGNLLMTVFRAQNGFLTSEVGWAALMGTPAVLSGLWVGSKVYARMPVQTLRKVIYAFLAISGIIAIVL